MTEFRARAISAQERPDIATDHYPALDGLRGVAALSVVFFHIGHWLHIPFLATNSGLAVDFFFCLSGYVLALAYAPRFEGGMSVARFLRLRLIRLMPLIVLATIISFVFVAVRPLLKHQLVTPVDAALALILGVLNLPYFNAPKILGGPQVFPLNGPQYSLFLEIVVNLFWSATRRISPLQFSLAVAMVSFLAVLALGFGGDETTTFWRGLPRVGLSFFLGVAAFRLSRGRSGAPSARLSWLFWGGTATMVLVFFDPLRLPFAAELLWVVLVSPLLVVAGAGVRLPSAAHGAALLMGELSYPVYCLHYPIFCWVNGVFQTAFKHSNPALESALIMAAILIGSYAALRLFDQPTRRWLSQGSRRSLAKANRTVLDRPAE
jgi:peptidoglycan/LPS O-acetylase OafA/YrhL